MDATSLKGGFADTPIDSAHAFRACLNAMARPGQIEAVAGAQPPAPLSVAAGVVLLTLTDANTPVHLAGAADTAEVRAWLAFHTGAPVVEPPAAAFALGRWEALPLSQLPLGTSEYPDRSATVIVEAETLAPTGARLTGPGVEAEAWLSLPEVKIFQENQARFPLGLDFFFAAGDRLAALPRSTKVETV